MRCTLSMCLCRVVLKIRRNVEFGGNTTLDTSNWESKFKVKRSNDKVTTNENVQIVFAHILAKSGSIYIKPRPE